MRRYVLGRLAQAIPVLVLVSIITFGLLRAAPGNPAVAQAGLNATPQVVRTISRQLGLNKPIFVQYWIWLRDVLHGNLGTSYTTGQPVTSILGPRVEVTLELALLALVLTALLGIPLGVWSALRRGRAPDRAGRGFALFFNAVPNFVIALLLVLIFGWWTRGIMPYQGFVPLGQGLLSNLAHLILPAIALAAGPIGVVARFTRASMLDVLDTEYVVAAAALGVPRWQQVWRDALRNAMTPVLTVVGLVAGYLISGTVVVETIFNLPGLGQELVESFSNRDYTVTISIVLLFSVAFVLINLLTDVLYAAVNPRIRAGYAGGQAG
jgi:peptide/nickel transport system permease protein